jgi:hypothetical protein
MVYMIGQMPRFDCGPLCAYIDDNTNEMERVFRPRVTACRIESPRNWLLETLVPFLMARNSLDAAYELSTLFTFPENLFHHGASKEVLSGEWN